MSDTERTLDYDNPQVAGFGTATAENPPFPAQQHLDAWDGEKGATVVVQEGGSGKMHAIAPDGEHVDHPGDDGDDEPDGEVEPEDAVAERNYEAKGVTKAHLEDEIDRRNETRAPEAQISKSGNKADLIAALKADDEATDQDDGNDDETA